MKAASGKPASGTASRPPKSGVRGNVGGAGEIRIVGGQWKRTRLSVASKPGLRPTPDRVRETLFNWLGQDLTGWRCVDAFAGTGALGLEAASRGALEVTLVEQDGELCEQIRRVAQKLQAAMVKVQRGDGVAWLNAAAKGGLDLVLLDPPFDADLFEPALRSAAQAMAPTGWIYLEAPRSWSDEELAAWDLSVHRHLKAGQVHAHLLRRRA